jgi:GT2 family glycosyltransferase
VFAYSVANEIQPDVVRWSGAAQVADFIDELVAAAKSIDPDCMCTYGNYPSTEFLAPQTLDFVCFNVYLHQPAAFKSYLARLQMVADAKPLVLGEFGVDSRREGLAAQSEMLAWPVELAFRSGLAGAVVFTFTDDWYRGGEPVTDWQLGLTTAARERKPAFATIQAAFAAAPKFPLRRKPRVSVVVASYNAAATLKACLESLRHLNYSDYEVILVDDGSTDATPRIVETYPHVRYLRHATNLGLSVARNTGLAAATGEIIAFTDADCRADEDWLYYLVAELLEGEFAAVGGHNLLPPDDSPVATAVMVSPGGPAHVMLTDREAEHIPGCNMAFFKSALEAIGGFDPIFRQAGDDVDVCWRLQQAGYKIGFCAAGFVWHYRRSTISAYLKQQRGYGQAEALLVRKHPEYFNAFGNSVWRGRIYAPAKYGLQLTRAPIIYHGPFGSAPFQTLYAAHPALTFLLPTTLEFHVLVTLPLFVLGVTVPVLLPVALASLLVTGAVCALAGAQATLPRTKRRWWSRPLVAWLFFLQPIVRGWERHQNRIAWRLAGGDRRDTLDSVSLRHSFVSLDEVRYWAERRLERVDFVARILRALERAVWPHRSDIGWSEYDVEVFGNRWSNVQLITAAEDHPRGRQLFRCKLRGRWSIQARVTLGLLVALEAVAGTYLLAWWQMLLLVGVTVPLFAWWRRRQQRIAQSQLLVLLDQLAKELQLIKISEPQAAVAAATPPKSTLAPPRTSQPIRVELPAVTPPPAAPPTPVTAEH